MLNFSLQPYEWQKEMEVILENINLSKIEFLDDCAINFSFLNSYDGSFCNKIICRNVWKFSKNNSIPKEECFPLFICDVRMATLRDEEITDAFKYFGFDLFFPTNNDYILLCLDSGEISISLICSNIEIL